MPRKKPVKDPQDDIEAICKLLCDEASNHMKIRNYTKASQVYNKALELNPNDQNALVARSKCYLLLGEPAKGLQDAETALAVEKDNIRAIYQKAEALYFMGQFEHSLMFFYRGLRLRPELNSFRLGIQKTQEAIEKTIGGFPKKPSQRSSSSSTNVKQLSSSTSTQTKHIAEVVTTIQKNEPKLINNIKLPSTKVNGVSGGGGGGGGDNHKTIRPKTSIRISAEKREARKLLGELCVDKEYLENLLKHPDLKRADTGSENISILAKEAVNFLNNRQEFWRQQRPCTALPKKMQLTNTGGSVATGDSTMPKWF